jgi:hypothetical protein
VGKKHRDWGNYVLYRNPDFQLAPFQRLNKHARSTRRPDNGIHCSADMNPRMSAVPAPHQQKTQ